MKNWVHKQFGMWSLSRSLSLSKGLLRLCLLIITPVTAQKNAFFDMKLLKTVSVGAYQGVNPIFVADLDGDSYPELVTVKSDFRDNAATLVIAAGPSFIKQTTIHFGASYGTPGVSFGYAYELFTSGVGFIHGSHDLYVGYVMDLDLFKKGKNKHKSIRIL